MKSKAITLSKSLDNISNEIETRPNWEKNFSRVVGVNNYIESINEVAKGIEGKKSHNADDVRSATLDSIRALMLIRAYRFRGHL